MKTRPSVHAPRGAFSYGVGRGSVLRIPHPLVVEEGGILDEGNDFLARCLDLFGGENRGERLCKQRADVGDIFLEQAACCRIRGREAQGVQESAVFVGWQNSLC